MRLGPRFGDPRNLAAATTLKRLAQETGNLGDADWRRLQPHFGWTSQRWTEAVNDSTRMVGFKNNITNLEAYLHALDGLLNA